MKRIFLIALILVIVITPLALIVIQKVKSADEMSYFVEDTKTYMSENFTTLELETISIGFINLETDREIYFNEEFLFYSASTIKVPINMYVYDLIEKGEVSLEGTITYT